MVLSRKDRSVRRIVAEAAVSISEQLKEDELLCLLERLHEAGDEETVMEIQRITKRRFLKILDQTND